MSKLVEDDTESYFEAEDNELVESMRHYLISHSISEFMELVGEALEREDN